MSFIPDPEDSRTPPQTEDSAERGWVEQADDTSDAASYDRLGESDALDAEDGDIADEGTGHRG